MTTTTLPATRVVRKAKNQRGWLYAILLVAVAGAVWLAYQRLRPAPPPATTSINVPVMRGDIHSTVSATGNLQPVTQVNLNFSAGGIVEEVLVKEGDVVKKGQSLVRLQHEDLKLAVITDEAGLQSAKIKLEQSKQKTKATDLASAQAKLESARASLDGLYAGPTAAELADAQARVTSARATLQKIKDGPTETEIANARQRLESSKNALWSSQSNRDAICGRVKHPDEDPGCSQARASVQQQDASVQIAQNDLDKLLAGPNANDVTVAEQSLRQAEAGLAKLRQGPTASQIAQAEASVTQAQASLDALLADPDTLAVQLAEIGVTQAEAKLKQSRLRLEQATLTTPMDGMVTTVNAVVGQTVGGGSNPIQLVDLSQLQIVAQVSELDRVKLKEGQPVTITLDAVTGVTLRGQVLRISPTGTSHNGVVNFPVTVQVTASDPKVAPGMTASLSILVENKQGVLRVPNRAVQTVGGQSIVNVVYEGQTIGVPVVVGISDGVMTEISSPQLKEGDQVVLSFDTGSAPGLIGGGNFTAPPLSGGAPVQGQRIFIQRGP